jgi:hypothetical protein
MATSNASYVMRIGTDPVLYLWTGFGDLVTPGDAVDPLGATWRGAGSIVQLPAIRALINGIAERLVFTLSGVDAEMVALALEDAADLQGADVRIGRVMFDQDWQLAGAIVYEWRGLDPLVGISSSAGDGGERQRTITVEIGSDNTRRANPVARYWTDAGQRLRAADDAFCDHVAQISGSITRRFGAK